MARKVFFSFHYDRDKLRIWQIRSAGSIGAYDKPPFYDKAEWERIERKGDAAIQAWIDKQLSGSSVTVVLLGRYTASQRWVKYEIAKSIKDGKGLLGINMSGMKDTNGNVDAPGSNPLPSNYTDYNWIVDNDYNNLPMWIEVATRKPGR